MGLWFTDGPARLGGFPGGAEMDLRAIVGASGRQLFGAGPSPRNYCGKGLGMTRGRQFAPPSGCVDSTALLARLRILIFPEENDHAEKWTAGCEHQKLRRIYRGGNVEWGEFLARRN